MHISSAGQRLSAHTYIIQICVLVYVGVLVKMLGVKNLNVNVENKVGAFVQTANLLPLAYGPVLVALLTVQFAKNWHDICLYV